MSEAIGNSHSAVPHYVDLMPTEMVERRVQLKKLLERYPVAIPVTEAANFLEMKEEGLRKSLLQGMCPLRSPVTHSLAGSALVAAST